MESKTILLTIIGMAAVTQFNRLAPLLILGDKPLPKWFVTWLKYVPVAVLSAMLLPELILKGGNYDFGRENLYLWIALPTFALGVATKSIFIPVIAGMSGIALARFLGGF